MRTFLVQYTDSAGPVSVWIEAESAAQIISLFEGVVVPDPVPDWATERLVAQFGSYKLSEPTSLPEDLNRRRRA